LYIHCQLCVTLQLNANTACCLGKLVDPVAMEKNLKACFTSFATPLPFKNMDVLLSIKAFAWRGRLQGLPIQRVLVALCLPNVKQISTLCIVLLTIDGTAARSLFCRRNISVSLFSNARYGTVHGLPTD
jgi:hypothetical protein